MNGALSKGAWEKKGEPSRGRGLVHGALIKVSELEKVWERAGEGKKRTRGSFFTHLARQVKDEGLHYLEKMTNRLVLGVKNFQRRPILEKRSPLFPDFLAGYTG